MRSYRHAGSLLAAIVIAFVVAACTAPTNYELILRGGTIYDGSGDAPTIGDVAFNGDKIAAIGDLGDAVGAREINVQGLAVAPGFVNMMSWANESLIEDGLSQSDIHQGVTLEIMGEGNSMGPLNDATRATAPCSAPEARSGVRIWRAWGSRASTRSSSTASRIAPTSRLSTSTSRA